MLMIVGDDRGDNTESGVQYRSFEFRYASTQRSCLYFPVFHDRAFCVIPSSGDITLSRAAPLLPTC